MRRKIISHIMGLVRLASESELSIIWGLTLHKKSLAGSTLVGKSSTLSRRFWFMEGGEPKVLGG